MNCIIYSIITYYYNLMQMGASTVQYLYSQSYELASLKGRSIYNTAKVPKEEVYIGRKKYI